MRMSGETFVLIGRHTRPTSRHSQRIILRITIGFHHCFHIRLLFAKFHRLFHEFFSSLRDHLATHYFKFDTLTSHFGQNIYP